MIKKLLYDRELFKKLFKIGLPVVIQQFIFSAVNWLDTFMIGRLGETEIAAVGLANQLYFVYFLIIFGLYSGCSVFVAQFWGKGDSSSIKRVVWIGFLSNLLVTGLISGLMLVRPDLLFALFTEDQEVIRMGCSYLRIIAAVNIFSSISLLYAVVIRAIGRSFWPMLFNSISLLVNGLLNYVLIFGKFGFPAMGIEGAALGTAIARVVEFFLFVIVVAILKFPIMPALKDLFKVTGELVKSFYKVALPIILSDMAWVVGFTGYKVIFARMGTEHIAAINISATIEGLCFVIFIGIGHATTVILGNLLGGGENGRAFSYAKKLLLLTLLMAILIGIAVNLAAAFILSFYNISPEVYRNTRAILFVFSLFLWAKVSNMVIMTGILRSGGDTRFALFAGSGAVWAIGLPLGVISGLVLGLPIYIVYAIVQTEEVVKFIFGLRRVFTRKWVNNLVEDKVSS